MANQLKLALIDTIQRLRQQVWSQRRIARELKIDRKTVAQNLAPGDPPQHSMDDGRGQTARSPNKEPECVLKSGRTATFSTMLLAPAHDVVFTVDALLSRFVGSRDNPASREKSSVSLRRVSRLGGTQRRKIEHGHLSGRA